MPPVTRSAEQRIDTATDDFIASQLPDWLKHASPGQINTLRERFKAHHASQQSLRKATLDLIPLQRYAVEQLTTLLPAGAPALETLQWYEVRKKPAPLMSTPYLETSFTREPALPRLMQNFHDGASFWSGTGVVPAGRSALLLDTPNLITRCRERDVGASYQRLLASTFHADTLQALASDKRASFSLCLEIATLKGQLTANEQIALHELTRATPDPRPGGWRADASLLGMLGQTLADAMLIQLRDARGDQQGVLLFLPSDARRALRKYPSRAAMAAELTAELRLPAGRQAFARLVGLRERAAFLALLDTRLKDAEPDLQLLAGARQDAIFEHLVSQQVARLKDDARLLLVPTAEVDAAAAKARWQAWRSAGLALTNLAGFFIPEIGALLLGQMVVQVLGEVYEGMTDWAQGHQHEALEHMLGVAETVAVSVAVAGGASIVAKGFARSPFVDDMEPVSHAVQGQRYRRLWSPDLKVYATQPDAATLQDDGLLASGTRRWLREQDSYYEVQRDPQDPTWRLRHPQREEAYGPALEHNGERGWWLRRQPPLEMDDSTAMLNRLWRQDPPLSVERAGQILQVAGLDAAALRGLLVERRAVPCMLRDTLQRFAAQARIEDFFAGLGAQPARADDAELLAWCKAWPGLEGVGEADFDATLQWQAPALRAALLEHLTRPPVGEDALEQQVARDFPSLPGAYRQTVILGASADQRLVATAEGRLPLALAQRARGLLGQARLARAREGLFLPDAYSNETGELVFALLRRLPGSPAQLNLELREGSENGRLVAVLDPQLPSATRVTMVYRNGRFRLYDSHGRALDTEVPDPGSIFEALTVQLSAAQLTRLTVGRDAAASRLRLLMQQALPASHQGQLELLGWRESTPWFNPGQRMADGRVGYPLSGRVTARRSSWAILLSRVRTLYPQYDEARAEQYLQQLLSEGTASAFELLLEQEEQYASLDSALGRWESSAEGHRNVRRRIGMLLRNAWRLDGEQVLDGEGNVTGMRLSLSGMSVSSLPAIPSHVDFSHVIELSLAEMGLQSVSSDFLQVFGSLHRLNLSDNRLARLPRGLGYLVELRSLRLARNSIRVDEGGWQVLASLPQLERLDLSHNPLGNLVMRFNQLPRLVELNLRYCQLSAMPQGLELCGLLARADLRNNDITRIEPELMRMPLAFRQALLLDHNLLPLQQRMQLLSIAEHVAHAEHPVTLQAASRVRSRWLALSVPAARSAHGELWDDIQGLPGADALFELLDVLQSSSDFQGASSYLSEQLWQLLAALRGNTELREEVFAHAANYTCQDSVADRFSQLMVRVSIAQANANAAFHERQGDLLRLGRQLFNLDQLERWVRAQLAARAASGAPAHGGEDIEVMLFYRVHLATTLDLPWQPRSMRFGRLAQVTDSELEAAASAVNAARTPQALAHFLGERDFWQAWLREHHAGAFDVIESRFGEQGTALDAEQATLDSATYQQRWQTLQAERASAFHTLTCELTQEVVDGLPPEQI